MLHRHAPSSLPLTEAGPLILCELGYMPEPIEYSEAEEKDWRFGLGWCGSSVGVREVESASSMAEPRRSERASSKLLASEAFEGRRE